jgi:hypothetical protein
MAFQALHGHGLTLRGSAAVLGVLCLTLAFVACALLPETFGKDLAYHEV